MFLSVCVWKCDFFFSRLTSSCSTECAAMLRSTDKECLDSELFCPGSYFGQVKTGAQLMREILLSQQTGSSCVARELKKTGKNQKKSQVEEQVKLRLAMILDSWKLQI